MDPQHPSDEPAPREGARFYYRDIGQGPPILVLYGGPGFDHHYLLPRNVAPTGGIVADAGDLLTFAVIALDDSAGNGGRVLNPDVLEAMRTPQVRAANVATAGFEEWCDLGWAIGSREGVRVIEHGGSIGGFQVKLKIVPARRYSIAILTNSGRGGVLGDRVTDWDLDHLLGLRAANDPQPKALSNDALARFAGRYRTTDGETATSSVEDGGLRRVISYADPGSTREPTFPPNLLKLLSEREFVVVTADENEGSRVDFIEESGGAIRFTRMDGRLYEPIAEEVGR